MLTPIDAASACPLIAHDLGRSITTRSRSVWRRACSGGRPSCPIFGRFGQSSTTTDLAAASRHYRGAGIVEPLRRDVRSPRWLALPCTAASPHSGGVTLQSCRHDGPGPRDWCAASRSHCFCTSPRLRAAGQLDQFAKDTFALEPTSVTHGAAAWQLAPGLNMSEVRLDGLLLVHAPWSPPARRSAWRSHPPMRLRSRRPPEQEPVVRAGVASPRQAAPAGSARSRSRARTDALRRALRALARGRVTHGIDHQDRRHMALRVGLAPASSACCSCSSDGRRDPLTAGDPSCPATPADRR